MFIRKVGLLKSRSFPFVKKWARHIIQSWSAEPPQPFKKVSSYWHHQENLFLDFNHPGFSEAGEWMFSAFLWTFLISWNMIRRIFESWFPLQKYSQVVLLIEQSSTLWIRSSVV
jgi:hypothetical protein